MRRASAPALLLALALLAPWSAVLPSRAQAQVPDEVAEAPAPAANGGRLAGPDRFATAAAIARAAWPDGAQRVYVARADVPVDALAAGVLRDGPVLLAPSCAALPGVVTDALDALGATAATLIGGPAALCAEVERDLSARGLDVSRLAGADRYGTAVEISRVAFPDGAWVAYLASGSDTAPDAVAGGVLTDGPILTVPASGAVPAAVVEELARIQPDEVVALGGPAAIADAVVAEAAGGRPVERAAGADRFGTALAIAQRAFPVGAPTVYVARADVFVDAVAGGALGDGPIVLVPSCGELDAAVSAFLDSAGPVRVVALGGSAAVCDALLASAAAFAVDLDAEVPGDEGGATGRDDVVVSPLARFPDAAGVIEVTDEAVVFDRTVAPEARALRAGDVLALDPSPVIPHGLLRRVVAVSVDGDRVTVQTAAADLADLLVGAAIDLAIPLEGDMQPGESVELDAGQLLTLIAETSTEQPQQAGARALRDLSPAAAEDAERLATQASIDLTRRGRLQLDFTQSAGRDVPLGGGTTVRGNLDVALSLNLKITIRANLSLVARTWNPLRVRGEITELDTEVVFDQSTGLSATWEAGVSGEVVRPLTPRPIDLGIAYVQIGPLVVPFTTELAFEVGGEWSAGAVATVGIEQTYQQVVGARYREGGRVEPYETHIGPEVQPVNASAQADLRAMAYVQAEVRSLAYDAAGPTAALRVFADGVMTWSTDPALRSGQVDLGLQPRFGLRAQIPLFGTEISDLEYAPVGDVVRTTVWRYAPEGDTGGAGDVKATLTWATEQDLDLHVVEPSGEEIYFADPTSLTGGQLDRDANPGCNDREAEPGGLENIFWPDFSAPPGTYVVSVVEYSLCGGPPPGYHIRIEVNGEVVVDEDAVGPLSWEVPV